MVADLPDSNVPCPCGLPSITAQCCGRYHAGDPAPTAETLMRSRYSAYVLGLNDYLLATWHETTRPTTLDLDELPKWIGLTVKQHLQKKIDNATLAQTEIKPAPEPATAPETAPHPEQATVEFVARYKINGRAHKLHEISRFIRENGRWYYIDGEITS